MDRIVSRETAGHTDKIAPAQSADVSRETCATLDNNTQSMHSHPTAHRPQTPKDPSQALLMHTSINDTIEILKTGTHAITDAWWNHEGWMRQLKRTISVRRDYKAALTLSRDPRARQDEFFLCHPHEIHRKGLMTAARQDKDWHSMLMLYMRGCNPPNDLSLDELKQLSRVAQPHLLDTQGRQKLKQLLKEKTQERDNHERNQPGWRGAFKRMLWGS